MLNFVAVIISKEKIVKRFLLLLRKMFYQINYVFRYGCLECACQQCARTNLQFLAKPLHCFVWKIAFPAFKIWHLSVGNRHLFSQFFLFQPFWASVKFNSVADNHIAVKFHKIYPCLSNCRFFYILTLLNRQMKKVRFQNFKWRLKLFKVFLNYNNHIWNLCSLGQKTVQNAKSVAMLSKMLYNRKKGGETYENWCSFKGCKGYQLLS